MGIESSVERNAGIAKKVRKGKAFNANLSFSWKVVQLESRSVYSKSSKNGEVMTDSTHGLWTVWFLGLATSFPKPQKRSKMP